MSLKDKIKKIKEDLTDQKEQGKAILKTKWNIGAEQGKALKKQHKEKIKKMVKKNEK